MTYVDRYQLEFRFAATLRALEWTGWRFGDRQVRLWHQTIGMTQVAGAARAHRRVVHAPPVHPGVRDVARRTSQRFIRRIREHQPVLVDGYAESFNFLATLRQQKAAQPGFSPKAIISSAQTLPDNVRATRSRRRSAPRCSTSTAAASSRASRTSAGARDHHVVDESYIVELLVDGRPAGPARSARS